MTRRLGRSKNHSALKTGGLDLLHGECPVSLIRSLGVLHWKQLQWCQATNEIKDDPLTPFNSQLLSPMVFYFLKRYGDLTTSTCECNWVNRFPLGRIFSCYAPKHVKTYELAESYEDTLVALWQIIGILGFVLSKFVVSVSRSLLSRTGSKSYKYLK